MACLDNHPGPSHADGATVLLTTQYLDEADQLAAGSPSSITAA